VARAGDEDGNAGGAALKGNRLAFAVLLSGCTVAWAGDAEKAAAMERLKAQIERQVRDFQQYPRKKFLGAGTSDARFAQYLQNWIAKIERIGTVNFPPEARGRLYGNVQLTVSIRSDGNVESVEVNRSSGHEVLDQGAKRIVSLAAPFAAFPPEFKRDTDILVITKTWHFVGGDTVSAE
jgi:protein TonB